MRARVIYSLRPHPITARVKSVTTMSFRPSCVLTESTEKCQMNDDMKKVNEKQTLCYPNIQSLSSFLIPY